MNQHKEHCKYCGRVIVPIEDIDETTERICSECSIKRDDAARDEALGI